MTMIDIDKIMPLVEKFSVSNDVDIDVVLSLVLDICSIQNKLYDKIYLRGKNNDNGNV